MALGLNSHPGDNQITRLALSVYDTLVTQGVLPAPVATAVTCTLARSGPSPLAAFT